MDPISEPPQWFYIFKGALTFWKGIHALLFFSFFEIDRFINPHNDINIKSII